MILSPEQHPQLFISDYEDCTQAYKSFADVQFEIPELNTQQIDSIMNSSKPHVIHRGLLNLYVDSTMRVINGWNPKNKHVLGRLLQSIYN